MPRLILLVTLVFMVLGAGPGAIAESRLALVVGNSDYVNTQPLANPKNDARDTAAALKAAGFEVVEALDADKSKLDGALRSFAEKLSGADVALFFYAGHGLQVGAQNYLVPIDAKLANERDLEFEAVKLDFVLRQMEIDREGKTTIVILDACRDNPLSRNLARSMGTRSASIGRGLAPAATGLGTFIAFSTQPGNVALDGSGRNSPFTAALVKAIAKKGNNLPATMIEVRKDVVASTDGKQVPWDHSAMTGDFYFMPGDATPAQGTISPAPAGSAADVAALQARLDKLEKEAKTRDATPPAPTAPPSPAAAQADALKLAELRKSAADLDGLLKSLERSREEAYRAGESQPAGSPKAAEAAAKYEKIEAEIERRSADLKKLEEEIAALTGTPHTSPSTAIAAVPPVTPKPTVTKTSANFEVADNVSLKGTPLRSFRAPNPIACREACDKEAACTGFQHGKKIGVMGTCELFSKVESRHEDDKWRSGVKTAANQDKAASAATEIAKDLPAAPSWQKFGFDAYEGFALAGGKVIKKSNVDSAAGCVNVCKNTAACIASFTEPTGTGTAFVCTALSMAGTPARASGSTAIVRRVP